MPAPRRLGLVTYRHAPDLAPDDRLLLGPLKDHGFDPFPIVWSETTPESIDADAIVIRSAWDYHLAPDRFLAWLTHVEHRGLRVFNHPSTIRWNMRKEYLLRLRDAGVRIPQTVSCRAWDPGLLAPFAGTPIVLKPAVSAGAHDTHRFINWNPEEIERHAKTMLSRGPILVQEYLREVESPGEWSFVFIGRTFSHALLKVAGPLDFRVQEEYGGKMQSRTPEEDILLQASAVLETIPDELLYARVDGVVRNGRLLLMELELFEPSLYLSFHSAAAETFAATLRRLTEDHGHRR